MTNQSYIGNLPDDQIFNIPSKGVTPPSYNVVVSDKNFLILADASSGTLTINLLDIGTVPEGFVVRIKKTDSSVNKVIVEGLSTQTIDGALNIELTNQNDAIKLVTTATEWALIATAPASFGQVSAGGAGFANRWLTEYDGSNNKNFTTSGAYSPFMIDVGGVFRIDNNRAFHTYYDIATTQVMGRIIELDYVGNTATEGPEFPLSGLANEQPGPTGVVQISSSEFLVFVQDNAPTPTVRVYSVILSTGNTITSSTLKATYTAGSIFSGTAGIFIAPPVYHGDGKIVVTSKSADGSVRLSYLTYLSGTLTVVQTLVYYTGSNNKMCAIAKEDENSGYFYGSEDNAFRSCKLFKYTLTPLNIVPGTIWTQTLNDDGGGNCTLIRKAPNLVLLIPEIGFSANGPQEFMINFSSGSAEVLTNQGVIGTGQDRLIPRIIFPFTKINNVVTSGGLGAATALTTQDNGIISIKFQTSAPTFIGPVPQQVTPGPIVTGYAASAASKFVVYVDGFPVVVDSAPITGLGNAASVSMCWMREDVIFVVATTSPTVQTWNAIIRI